PPPAGWRRVVQRARRRAAARDHHVHSPDSESASHSCRRSGGAQGGCGQSLSRSRRVPDGAGLDPADARGHDRVSRCGIGVAPHARASRQAVVSRSRAAGRLRWGIATLLFLSTIVNYIDRQTLSVLAPQLKTEFGWSNADFAWIIIAFRVAYGGGQ